MHRITSIHLFVGCLFTCLFYVYVSCQDVAKLPYCRDDIKRSQLILVSTLDGYLTALTPSGEEKWHLETGPGPLLRSNIHKLELTNQGQWMRIIPSLSGSLYKFDGLTIDPIPITADTLLMSSFRYSDDLVIAGGREVRTYGIQINTGKPLYTCSFAGCANATDYADDLEDIIIIQRKTHTVRAVEPRTGVERWNFSVGQHDIKIPYVTCIDGTMKLENFNLSVVLPEGLLMANRPENPGEILWSHKFDAPIVAVWRWNGRNLTPVNLFNSATIYQKNMTKLPSIYVGMHNKQLYVHESASMQNIVQLNKQLDDKHSVIESESVTQISWKPVPAMSISDEADDDSSTALSVLYASEFINGNGYYLYTDTDEKSVCESNTSNPIRVSNTAYWTIRQWWKQAFVVALVTITISNLIYTYGLFGFGRQKQENALLPLQSSSQDRTSSYSESSDGPFTSRYITEFEPISCLGKGGFGVVFQAKKKFDECDYAVKRITLPNKPHARDRMMREVKALAKLDHSNIVRYYNAWLECPPHGWQQQHDNQWLSDLSTSFVDKSTSVQPSLTKENSSCAIVVESSNSSVFKRDSTFEKKSRCSESSSIVFEKSSSTTSTAMKTSSHSDSDDEMSESEINSIHPYQRPASVYLYIQMQLCCKESLKDWLCNKKERDRGGSLNIFEQIVDAVEYVHFRGLIHRDLKPSNIFFSLEGQIKVGDFGLVTSIKEYDAGKESVNTTLPQQSYTNAVGTQLYMSPEQLKNQQYDHKVDIYSLGIIFFELLVSFTTEMERIRTLTDLHKNLYPNDFSSNFVQEYDILQSMLSVEPEVRPSANEIRRRLALQSGSDENA